MEQLKPKEKYTIIIKFLVCLALATIYLGTAQLGLLLAILPGNITTVWITSGISLGAVLLLGYWVLPGIALGALLAETSSLVGMTATLSPGTFLAIALIYTAAHTLQPLILAFLLKLLMKPEIILSRVKNVLLFVPLAGIGSIVGATLGMSYLYFVGHFSLVEYGFGWLTWWLASTLSHLIFTPVLLAWNQQASSWENQLLPTRKIEAALLLGLVLFGSWITFASGCLLACILLPLLLWSVFRFGKRCTSLLVVLVSVSAIITTQRGLGAFVLVSPQESLLSVQSFISVFAVISLIVSAIVDEWEIVKNRTDRSLYRITPCSEPTDSIYGSSASRSLCS